MSSVEELLESVLTGRDTDGSVDSGSTSASGSDGKDSEGLDVASFVENLGKTASALKKAAESLPTSPSLAAKQLRMLDNPLGFTRSDVHEVNRALVGKVFPAARASLRVPKSLGEIQNADSVGSSFFANRLGR